MIASSQIRASRAMLRISASQLAEATGLALFTIQRLERDDAAIQKASMDTIVKIKNYLEKSGIKLLSPKEKNGRYYGVGLRLNIKN